MRSTATRLIEISLILNHHYSHLIKYSRHHLLTPIQIASYTNTTNTKVIFSNLRIRSPIQSFIHHLSLLSLLRKAAGRPFTFIMHSTQTFSRLSSLAGILATISKTSALVIPPARDDVHQSPEGYQDDHNNHTDFENELMNQHPAYPLLRYFSNRLIGDNDAVSQLDDDNTASLSARDVTCNPDDHSDATLSKRNDTARALHAWDENSSHRNHPSSPNNHNDGMDTELHTRSGGPDDKVPLHELPSCYYECMVENCCNMWAGGPGNVSEMTTHEFCVSKWFYVGNWIFDKVQYCLLDKCNSCRPGCAEESNLWVDRVCGESPWG